MVYLFLFLIYKRNENEYSVSDPIQSKYLAHYWPQLRNRKNHCCWLLQRLSILGSFPFRLSQTLSRSIDFVGARRIRHHQSPPMASPREYQPNIFSDCFYFSLKCFYFVILVIILSRKRGRSSFLWVNSFLLRICISFGCRGEFASW